MKNVLKVAACLLKKSNAEIIPNGELMIPEPSRDLYVKIANLVQYIIYNPILWNEQEACCGETPDVWTADEWTIEVGKFLLMGEDAYLRDITPVRRYDNNALLFQKNTIRNYGEQKYNLLQNLNKVKDLADNILICEVGRGIDLVLADHIKQWSNILCYDVNDKILSATKNYFNFFKSADFILKNTSFFDFSSITVPTILVCSDMHVPLEGLQGIKNPNIKTILWDGEIKND